MFDHAVTIIRVWQMLSGSRSHDCQGKTAIAQTSLLLLTISLTSNIKISCKFHFLIYSDIDFEVFCTLSILIQQQTPEKVKHFCDVLLKIWVKVIKFVNVAVTLEFTKGKTLPTNFPLVNAIPKGLYFDRRIWMPNLTLRVVISLIRFYSIGLYANEECTFDVLKLFL